LITPQMRIGELLAAYPELEDVLIETAPAFKKLRNPALRKTVARVTSLAQAARVGGVPVTEIVQRLRAAAGQSEWSPKSGTDGQREPGLGEERPDWLREATIQRTLDARPMIEAGEQPLTTVLRELTQLPENAVYELITPFEPAPLIDRAKKIGFVLWTAAMSASEYRTYFIRPRQKS
jgi:hypothetical protein